jgi:hypothetical protein
MSFSKFMEADEGFWGKLKGWSSKLMGQGPKQPDDLSDIVQHIDYSRPEKIDRPAIRQHASEIARRYEIGKDLIPGFEAHGFSTQEAFDLSNNKQFINGWVNYYKKMLESRPDFYNTETGKRQAVYNFIQRLRDENWIRPKRELPKQKPEPQPEPELTPIPKPRMKREDLADVKKNILLMLQMGHHPDNIIQELQTKHGLTSRQAKIHFNKVNREWHPELKIYRGR